MGGVNCTNCSCNNDEANEMADLNHKKKRQHSINMKNKSFE